MSMIQFHILRNYSSSNLNRDEIGAPKTAIFAGVQRGRISSQCLKRSWRNSDAFKALDSLGIRTQLLPELVVDRVKEIADQETYAFAVKNKKVFSKLGKSSKNKDGAEKDGAEKDSEIMTTKQLMFFSNEDIDMCVQAILNADKDAKKLKNKIAESNIRAITLDIALFGRMITDDKFADVEASLQVAHSISTNRVNQETDFFTAVDDLAAFYNKNVIRHLDDCDFNSCCYYIYAALDVDQLKRNLKNSPDVLDKLPLLLSSLLDAMVYTSPTGKQNSFAAHSLPSVVCVEQKNKKIPVSYVNAFEEPVIHNYSVESTKRLATAIDAIDRKFDTAIEKRLWFDVNEVVVPQNADVVSSIKEMQEIVATWIK